jgi:hypothetical protein
MTDDEWAAKVAELAAAGESVYAIPVKDNTVEHVFGDLPDRGC